MPNILHYLFRPQKTDNRTLGQSPFTWMEIWNQVLRGQRSPEPGVSSILYVLKIFPTVTTEAFAYNRSYRESLQKLLIWVRNLNCGLTDFLLMKTLLMALASIIIAEWLCVLEETGGKVRMQGAEVVKETSLRLVWTGPWMHWIKDVKYDHRPQRRSIDVVMEKANVTEEDAGIGQDGGIWSGVATP